MERFALAAAVVLGFALTAALCSLFVPLRRVLERREQNQQPAQSEQPRPAPLRAPLWGGLCAAAGTVAAVGVGWLAACVSSAGAAGQRGSADDAAAHGAGRKPCLWGGGSCRGPCPDAQPGGAGAAAGRPPFAGGTGRGIRSFAAAGSEGCLPRGLGVPGAGYVLLGSAVPLCGRCSWWRWLSVPASPSGTRVRCAARPLWLCWR
ncbi:MAG: hypothetical protein ACLVJH_05920 [Faecalibacterium prausnitzii]